MTDLISRPFIETNESTIGYVLRLANENGFDGLSKFTLAIADKLACHDLRQLSRADLAELSGYEEPEIWSHVGSYYLPGKHRYFYRLDNGEMPFLPKEALNYLTPRVCPMCVGEDKYIRHEWDLALSVYCPKHELLLQDRCPSCSEQLTWARPYLLQCSCGLDLSAFTIEKAPQAVVDFHWLMFIYRQGTGIERKVWMRGWPRWFAKLTLTQVSRGVLRFIHFGYSRIWQEAETREDFGLRVIDIVFGVTVIMQMLRTNHFFTLQALRLLPEEKKYRDEIDEAEGWNHSECRTLASRKARKAFHIRKEPYVDN